LPLSLAAATLGPGALNFGMLEYLAICAFAALSAADDELELCDPAPPDEDDELPLDPQAEIASAAATAAGAVQQR